MQSIGRAPWWGRPGVIVASAISLAAAAVAVAAWASSRVDEDSPGGLAEPAVGPLLGFAGAVLITGVVGVWVSAARGRDEIEREHRVFLESQIVMLWSVHDRLKTSAVLISAHRTAKTYSEQMQEIIAARTRLSEVEDTIERQTEPLVTRHDFDCFQLHLRQAASFLHPLVDEYRQHYLEKVSYAQRVDEAHNRKLDDEDDCDPRKRSTRAWDALQVESDFPTLGKLRRFGDLKAEQLHESSRAWREAEMTKEFFLPLMQAIEVLVACRMSTTGRSSYAIPPTEAATH